MGAKAAYIESLWRFRDLGKVPLDGNSKLTVIAEEHETRN